MCILQLTRAGKVIKMQFCLETGLSTGRINIFWLIQIHHAPWLCQLGKQQDLENILALSSSAVATHDFAKACSAS